MSLVEAVQHGRRSLADCLHHVIHMHHPHQVGLLKSLRELLVHKEPLLLDEYIHDVAELQLTQAPSVKKALADFVGAAAGATRSPTALVGCTR